MERSVQKKGTVVATLTTDEKGKAETEALYLGKYVIKETKAPNGYLLNPKEFAVTLEYEDQETEIVYGDVTVPDELAKGKIRVKKTDAETGNGLSGAEFEIRAKEDIVTPDGTVKAKAGTVVDTITTSDKGTAETKKIVSWKIRSSGNKSAGRISVKYTEISGRTDLCRSGNRDRIRRRNSTG